MSDSESYLLLLLLNLFHHQLTFLILASFILEPDANDPWREASHLNQLFLHECIRPRVLPIACTQSMQLFLIQDSAYACRLLPVLLLSTTDDYLLVHRSGRG